MDLLTLDISCKGSHIIRMVLGLAFFDWLLSLGLMFSKLIHVVARVRGSFLLIVESQHAVWTYHKVFTHPAGSGIGVVPSLGLL